ncbi:hypothetical protein AE929_09565 [Xanthomonas arboricola]|uniref:Uncharacterized protein n=1 Tax=Xanthomonas campestris pv. juglandis TaxID=195709 RepID=A0A8E4MEH8_XANCJ|nr:hypothetical protein [Xanthomonas arboricola]KOA98610.1 hypothetical protein AE920_15010 [Xanthomonas arboricola]KOB25224.1 hypothetical protein AE927_16035 [Xanthomonas arboricola]KOB35688.1 hypothetical protein AE929_09565 [Xanthomonas arboricola]KOB45382.1 hypothetical protein AE931_05265 [Xanthomonas arboricola]OAH85432.1 hypothetical protein AXA70_19885 [Xanthomonas arboricola pv. juglandis]
MSRVCTSCTRRLDESEFPTQNGRVVNVCVLCRNDIKRAQTRLAPIRRDPEQIRLNNICCTWFGPVQRTHLLRNAA